MSFIVLDFELADKVFLDNREFFLQGLFRNNHLFLQKSKTLRYKQFSVEGICRKLCGRLEVWIKVS